ncbi:hypothetical protein [Streptomyces sp. NPDC088775]|uniref:hypothetical protein n=1 Tax=Streptomyces sp. NPDC088775 TaxID=3365896 RepID=UPI0037F952C9
MLALRAGKLASEAEEQTESLDERVPPARAHTLRLTAAWFSKDPASFEAFTAAAGDPAARVPRPTGRHKLDT